MTVARIEAHKPSPFDVLRKTNHILVEGTVFGGENTLAFNLASEWDRARESGEGYRKTFIDNAHFYAGETYLRGRAAMFEYRVTDSGELFYPNSDISAVKSFQKPVEDLSRPDWLRQRDRKDLMVVTQIENNIKTAQIGDTWIAASPAISENEIPEDIKLEWGYGRHSFLFLHQLQIDPATGQRRLVCRALRHYLSEDAQRELVSRLGEQTIPDDAELHGYVAKLTKKVSPRNFRVQDSLHVAHIHSVGNKIAEEKGELYWGQEHSGLSSVGDLEKLESERMLQISKLDWWLEDIYQDIMDLGKAPKLSRLKAIESKFRGWEGAAKAISEDKEINIKLFVTRPKDQRSGGLWKESLDIHDPRVAYIQAALTMQGGIGTCGVGSGFGIQVPGTISASAVAMFGMHPIMSSWADIAPHIRIGEFRKETSTHYESYQCPGCKNWLPGEKKDDRSSWRTKCEHCGNKLNC